MARFLSTSFFAIGLLFLGAAGLTYYFAARAEAGLAIDGPADGLVVEVGAAGSPRTTRVAFRLHNRASRLIQVVGLSTC